jgi:hypothetical protein
MTIRPFMKSIIAGIAGASLFLIALPATAHHSKALQFDMTKNVSIEGVIVGLEWRNPHAWLSVEAPNEAGEMELWQVEFGSANSLIRRGWRPDDLPIGTGIEVHGLPARDGSRTIDGEEVTLSNGKTLLDGSAPGDR